MTPPLVAVTTYPAGAEGRISQPTGYHDAIRRAGGRALLVPPGETDPAGLLDTVDALVLTGGGDIHPRNLGLTTHPEVYGTSELRDTLELELARLAVERTFPTLAICRGMQVLNVALGGTLHLHLPDVVGTAVIHRADPPGPVPHAVAVTPGSLIARAMDATEITVSSWHHQALDLLGTGLTAVAHAADATIEAVELAGHPFLEAMQWHPELTAATDPTQQALFDALVAHVAAAPVP
ncbi:MAG: gamma-glutamyl-gamma-aminobutyrate hydrolase family protein [Acidimicrobiales bacterium]